VPKAKVKMFHKCEKENIPGKNSIQIYYEDVENEYISPENFREKIFK
jgi:hypothetical protein